MTPAKKLIAQELDLRPSQLSVTSGRGTASHWLYVKTENIVTEFERARIEKKLVKAGLVGQYLTDYGRDDHYQPCILWRIK